MGTFTMTLNDIVKMQGGSTLREDGITKLINCDLGLSDYPIFEDAHREVLNGHIFDYYINREIGFETIGMFVQRMRTTMNLEMPTFNELYRSTQFAFDPLTTIKMTTETENSSEAVTDNTGEATTSVNANGKSRAVASSTPQTMLSGSQDYATSATDTASASDNVSIGNEDSTSATTADSNGTSTVSGYQGVPSSLVMQFRDSIINVDRMIIDRLETLFMSVWDNGDTHTKGSYYGNYFS